MIIIGLIEWIAIISVCYLGMGFNIIPLIEWLESHYG